MLARRVGRIGGPHPPAGEGPLTPFSPPVTVRPPFNLACRSAQFLSPPNQLNAKPFR